ncbi:hypothetical protein Gohar_025525, partial [Gossypium harknessii]|nr:hypothetical protein [Gossypium harknessii]
FCLVIPCGPRRQVPSSCGNIFDKLVKRKANTVHCLRFPGDWYRLSLTLYYLFYYFSSCYIVIVLLDQSLFQSCMSFFMQFDCSKGVALMEEQFFIMKPDISSRSLNSIQQLIKQQNTFVLVKD